MNFLRRNFGFRFTTGHAIWAATLIPACIAVCMHFKLLWLGITLSALIALFSVLTIRGYRLTGWVRAVFSWRRRHRSTPMCRRSPRSAPRSCRETTSPYVGRVTTWLR